MTRLVLLVTDVAQIVMLDPPLPGTAEQERLDRAVRRQRILSASKAMMLGEPPRRQRRRTHPSDRRTWLRLGESLRRPPTASRRLEEEAR
jgi:hypothetical protein